MAIITTKCANNRKKVVIAIRIGRDPPGGRAFPGLYYSSTPTSQFLKFQKKLKMPDLIDDIRTINAREDVKLILAHMAPDKDYKKLIIPFDNWNVTIFYSEDENGKKCWEQSIRSPGAGSREICLYADQENKGESNDVLPNRSSTSKPAPSRENPGYGG